MLRSDVATAVEEGWSNDRLADALEQNHAFSEERAMTIARTETAATWTTTTLNSYQANGISSYESSIAHGPTGAPSRVPSRTVTPRPGAQEASSM
jgi:hypothetical protein